MRRLVEVLERVTYRYAPSRAISFDIAHVLKALQIIMNGASRARLMRELGLGEGSIKTLIKHMKMNDLIYTDKKGIHPTDLGLMIYKTLSSVMDECELPPSSITLGRFNYAILLRGVAHIIGSGIEQRDAALVIGALGATTLIYNQGFIMKGNEKDPLENEPYIRRLLMNLAPNDGDVIIIGTANDRLKAELGAKRAAMITLKLHF